MNSTVSSLILIMLSIFSIQVNAMEIVTVFNDEKGCLSKKAEAIPLTKEGLQEAKRISEQLKQTLIPLMPAAGLAAPQIGISKQVFIYTWDRSQENIETVINPTIEPLDQESIASWEACFSTIQKDGISKAAFVKRPTKILVRFTNLEGQIVQKKLVGFAARVFQHELDHLQGIENIRKQGAEVKKFDSTDEFKSFMKSVKAKDSVNYVAPIAISNQG